MLFLCSSARICSTPLRFFSYLCLCIAKGSLAYLCHSKASLHSAFPSPCPSSRSPAIPLRLVTTLYAAIAAHRTHRTAFALHSRAARICSTPLRCLAAHTTPSLAFAFRHEALHFLCFSYRGKSDPSNLRLSTPLLCAFQLSLAFATRRTAEPCLCPALHCSDYLCPC